MIALLTAAALLTHRTMWVTPNYVLAATGTLVAVRGDSSQEYVDTKTRHVGAIVTAAPLNGGGFVYILRDGGVRTWSRESGITKLSSLPDSVNLNGNWTIFPYANGKYVLQPEDRTDNVRAVAYLYDKNQAWRAIQPDMELNGAIVLHGQYIKLFPVDDANVGHVNFTELSLDDTGDFRPELTEPGAPIISHGGPMHPMHIVNLDLGGFIAKEAVATDTDSVMAFASDTQVAVFGSANHERLATFEIRNFKPNSLVVAQSQGGIYILYGLTHENVVEKRMPNADQG